MQACACPPGRTSRRTSRAASSMHSAVRLRRRAADVVSRHTLMLVGVDLALVLVAGWAAFWLRFNFDIPPEFLSLAVRAIPWAVFGYASGLSLARVYRQVWSYVGLTELRQLGLGILLGGVVTAAI